MFVKVFKAITSIILIGTLIVLVTKRDFLLPKKILLKNPVKSAQEESIPLTQSETLSSLEASVSIPEVELKKSTTAPLIKAKAVTQVVHTSTREPNQKIVRKVPEITQSDTYIKMNPSPSDNDVTYRPPISPCKVTMGYKIGTLDAHFGISKQELIDELGSASLLWNDAAHKTLFAYNENGTLTINLLYDERQARTESINSLGLEIENSKQNADSLRVIYEKEKEKYTSDSQQLNQDTENFQIQYKLYTNKVAMYNAQGGAPRAEYDAMTNELESLKLEVKILETRRIELLAFMETINTKVNRYNELVLYINSLIKQSNTLGSQKFTEGMFSSGNNTITIYQYSNKLKLRRVLAHEFGHAIGINHNNNVYSIMYSLNSATTTALSTEDTDALTTVCSTY